jgi:hypothetical protein
MEIDNQMEVMHATILQLQENIAKESDSCQNMEIKHELCLEMNDQKI